MKINRKFLAAGIVLVAGAALTGCGVESVFSLAVGDCFNESGDVSAESSEEIGAVPMVECSEPHDYEIYHDFMIDGDEFPGGAAVTADAEEKCVDAFGDFVGIDPGATELAISFFYPTEASWSEQNDRLVSCLIYDPVEQASGTLKDAQR